MNPKEGECNTSSEVMASRCSHPVSIYWLSSIFFVMFEMEFDGAGWFFTMFEIDGIFDVLPSSFLGSLCHMESGAVVLWG